jgi:DNA-binding beta-propeller fold protein YncE
VIAANFLPHTLALFDADLNLVRTYAAATLDGRASSRVSAVYDAAPRHSFVVALKDIPELWEISYDPRAEPVYDGLVHDHRMGEALGRPGYLNVRRTPLDEPLDDFFFDDAYRHVIGTARAAADGSTAAQVVNLDTRRRIATVPLAGMPHLGSGITFDWNGTRVLATTNLKQGVVTVIDTHGWKTVRQIATPGPGFFLRSHERTPYAWVDAMMSPARDTMLVIDKRTLEVVRTLRPAPGRTVAHVEFSHDGRYALVSLWEDDGAVIVYDAATLQEVKRLPMRKPVGKYNVGNKLARSEGTSH